MKGRHGGDQRILKGGVVMWAVGAGPAEAPRGGTGTQGGGSNAAVGWPAATRERQLRVGGGVGAPHGRMPVDR
jgi:hypothetical protein